MYRYIQSWLLQFPVNLSLQVAGFGLGNDALLLPERHTQGAVQKYSKDTQIFPDLCIS